jgi:hypothetical protein
MLRRLFGRPSVSLLLLVLLVSALMGGCQGFYDFFSDALNLNDEADAQDNLQWRVETFTGVTSFLIVSDTEPVITIHDGTTEYTGMDGTLNLGNSNLELQTDDRVIERPTSATVTLITAR